VDSLDVGVETILKTYLLLPEDDTGANTKYHDRKKASKGNFHELLEAVKKAAYNKLVDINLSHVKFYHDLRNKLYHQGNGITVPTEKSLGYAQIAVRLLNILLDIDLFELLEKPELDAKKREKINQELDLLNDQVMRVQKSIKKLQHDVLLAIEKIEPRLLMPSFISKLQNLVSTDPIEQLQEITDLLEDNIDDDNLINALKAMLSDPINLFEFLNSTAKSKTSLYLMIANIYIQDDHPWPGCYEIAELYPMYAQLPRPTDVIDENGFPIHEDPPLKEVIERGNDDIEKIENFRKLIHDWLR